MDDRHCEIQYCGNDYWDFVVYQDGECIFLSNGFWTEKECETASQLWLQGESK
jgi:hypothetical protein